MKLEKQHILTFSLLLIGGILFFVSNYTYVNSYEGQAKRIIEICSTDPYPPSCYDKEIPKVMDRGFTFEEAFEITGIIQSKVNDYWYCHILGHNLSAKEAAKDLSKWKEVMQRAPIGVCSNGAIHGAFQERFRDEVLTDNQIEEAKKELKNVCENSDVRTFTGLEQASCYHALGHLTMYITNANISKSTSICRELAIKEDGRNFLQTCYEGAYMQIFQPIEPEDFALIKDIAPETREEADLLCDKAKNIQEKSACQRESWPLYAKEIRTTEGIQDFCNKSESEFERRICFNGVFYINAAQLGLDFNRIHSLCQTFPEDLKAQCYANSASRYVETDYKLIGQAVKLCEIAETEGVGERCYDELLYYSDFNFHKGSEEFNELCNALPEDFSRRCFDGDIKRIRYAE